MDSFIHSLIHPLNHFIVQDLLLGSGVYNPEMLLVQEPVLAVSVPTVSCVDGYKARLSFCVRNSICARHSVGTVHMHYVTVQKLCL